MILIALYESGSNINRNFAITFLNEVRVSWECKSLHSNVSGELFHESFYDSVVMSEQQVALSAAQWVIRRP